tara:strand:+ start:630 stop:827 length:198 start_codon:yes stop_codon:yes gene_type:complete
MIEILEITIVICSLMLTTGISFLLVDVRTYLKAQTSLLKDEKEYRSQEVMGHESIHDYKEIYHGN